MVLSVFFLIRPLIRFRHVFAYCTHRVHTRDDRPLRLARLLRSSWNYPRQIHDSRWGERAHIPMAPFPIIDALRLQVVQLVAEMVHHSFPYSPRPHNFLGDHKQVFLGDILKGPHLFAAAFAAPF